MAYAGTLEVLVVEGKGLRSRETFGKQDPYVKLMMDMEQVRSKTHENGGKNPTWNQNLFLNIIPGQTILKVECWDSDAASDDLIGAAVVNLDPILKVGSQDLWVDLRSKSGSNAGQIRLVIYFKSKAVQAPQQFNGQTPYAMNGPMVQQYAQPPPPQQTGAYGYAPMPMQPMMQQPMMAGQPPMMMPGQPMMQGYPQQMPGYPPQQMPGYPPQMQGYPQQMPGMPMQQPTQYPTGYPPNQGMPVNYNNGGYPGAR
jgi:hypothetical protein